MASAGAARTWLPWCSRRMRIDRRKDTDLATQSVEPRPEFGPLVLQPPAKGRDHPVLGADEARRSQAAGGGSTINRLRPHRCRLDGAVTHHETFRSGGP